MVRIADEKVNLAHQIYDFVDKHICSLDKDLRTFDGELDQERERLGLPVGPFPYYRGSGTNLYTFESRSVPLGMYKVHVLTCQSQ